MVTGLSPVSAARFQAAKMVADLLPSGFAFFLPGRLPYAGDLALIRQLAEANAANAVVPEIRVGPAADLAAVVAAAGEFGLSLLF